MDIALTNNCVDRIWYELATVVVFGNELATGDSAVGAISAESQSGKLSVGLEERVV